MNIYESIAAIQADVDFIGKNKQVQSGGSYKYRGVDQVLNTLHPLFAKHKVFAVPEVLEVLFREHRETKNGGAVVYQGLRIRYTFFAEDGSNVSAVVMGEAMDSGDKASNKCMSVAYKYACFQLLSIPTEETTADPDDDAQSLKPHSSTEKDSGKKPEKKNRQEETKSRGIQLSELRDLGVEDVSGMAKYLGEKLGKPISEFDDGECESALEWVKNQVAKKKAQKQFEEAEGEIPFD